MTIPRALSIAAAVMWFAVFVMVCAGLDLPPITAAAATLLSALFCVRLAVQGA